MVGVQEVCRGRIVTALFLRQEWQYWERPLGAKWATIALLKKSHQKLRGGGKMSTVPFIRGGAGAIYESLGPPYPINTSSLFPDH